MKKPAYDPAWSENWKSSYGYDLQEVFDQVRVYGYSYAYARRMRAALAMLQQAVAPPAAILDVAAGAGNFSLRLSELGYEVTWNDLRSELEGYVRLKHERGMIQYAPGNIFELGFEGLFDVVLITEIIEHVAHPDAFLAKIGRMVRPGGYIVMTTPNGGYFLNRLPKFSQCRDPSQFEDVQFKPNSDGHIFLLHEDEIAALAANAGLKVEKIVLSTNPLTNGHLRTESLLARAPRWPVEILERATGSLPRFLRRRVNSLLAVLFWKPLHPEIDQPAA